MGAAPSGRPQRPLALLLGGETTVDLRALGAEGRAPGLGGRNSEMALAFGLQMLRAEGEGGAASEAWPAGMGGGELPWAAAFFATDGGDGPTDAAGAVVTAHTPVLQGGAQSLAAHDSYSFFSQLDPRHVQWEAQGGGGGVPLFLPGRRGGLIKTGPTGTNVCDVTIILLDACSDASTASAAATPAMAQRCSAPECAAESKFACSRCHAAFYCGEPCQKAHWPAHKPGCAAAAPAPTAAAQGGGAGAGAGSGGGRSAASASAPFGKRFLYSGLEQVVEDPRCGACGKDLSHRGKGCEEEHLACGACRKVPYCDMVCLESHYLGHMEECFEVIAARVQAGDVHKDDSSGEYVLKDFVGECTSKYGALDERTLYGQRIYGLFLRKLGRLEEAKVLLLAARKGFMDSFGPRHAGTLACASNLAGLLQAQGKLDEAKPLFVEVLESNRATLGPKHPDTLISMNNLAAQLQAEGKLDEAKPLYVEALEAQRATLGPKHPSTLISMNNLAALLQAQGKLDEAKPLMVEALEARRATLGSMHPDSLTSAWSLACLLHAQGRAAEAEALFREALTGLRSALGDAHPRTQDLAQHLLHFLTAQGKHREARELKAAFPRGK
jgi:tetratricopeptide (TPR) repeat protein